MRAQILSETTKRTDDRIYKGCSLTKDEKDSFQNNLQSQIPYAIELKKQPYEISE